MPSILIFERVVSVPDQHQIDLPDCTKRLALIADYSILARRYAEAVARLGSCVDRSVAASYAEVREALNDAESARMLFECHADQHGCTLTGDLAKSAVVRAS